MENKDKTPANQIYQVNARLHALDVIHPLNKLEEEELQISPEKRELGMFREHMKGYDLDLVGSRNM